MPKGIMALTMLFTTNVTSLPCFDTQRLPKTIQSAQAPLNNSAQAITASEDLYSLFVGGYLPQTDWENGHTAGWAHIGRLDLTTNMWDWQYQVTDKGTGQILNTITALAVSPDDTKLACHGWRSKDDSVDHTIGYLFMLSTETGKSISGLMRMTHNKSMTVKSAGFLLTDSGIAIMTPNVKGNYNGESFKQRYKFIAIDMVNMSVHYNMNSSDFFGSSAALIRGTTSLYPDLYSAGSYTWTNDGSLWDLGIVRISNYESTSPSFHSNVMFYHDQRGKNDWWKSDVGYPDFSTAPMITHLGMNHELGHSSRLFGLTQGHNHAGSSYQDSMYIWHAKLQSSAQDLRPYDGARIRMKQLIGLKQKSFWAGMRPSMEYISGQDQYIIHAIFQEEEKRDFYIRVNPESSANIKAIRINKNDHAMAFEAVWVGTKTQIFDPSGTPQTAYEAYYAGSHKEYSTVQNGANYVNSKRSYAVVGIVEGDDLCTEHQPSSIMTISVSDPPNFFNNGNVVRIRTETFMENTIQTVFDASGKLTILPFDYSKNTPETLCNWQETTILSAAAGSPSLNTFSPQCYNYLSESSLTFDPPTITSPTGCTDTQWLYKVVPDVALPSEIQITFDASLNKVFWGMSDGSTPGNDPSLAYGVYNVQVDATLQDSSLTTVTDAFNFQLDIDCCAPPTIVTAPTVTAAGYTYSIGDAALAISLSGPWTSDKSCCTPSTTVPQIVSVPEGDAPPSGLFTVSNANQQVDVSTIDVSASGPSGKTYQVTTSTTLLSSTCTASTASPVSYTVTIVNPCETASFSVDPSIFLIDTSIPTLSYTVADPAGLLTWKSSTHITSSITGTDYCGVITQEIYDVSMNPLGDPLPSILTFSQSGDDNSLQALTLVRTDAQDYILQLQVYYQDFEALTKKKVDFLVSIVDPCISATLSIDDSKFKTPPTVTKQQYVNYPAIGRVWYDTIVSSSVTQAPNPCPPLVHDIIDTATSSTPNSLVFTLDLATPQKTIFVATTDMTLAKTYTLAIQVFYDGLRVETEASKQFLIVVSQYCIPTSITEVQFTTASLTYELGRAAQSSSFTDWTTDPAECNLVYTMKIYSDAAKTTEVTEPLADPNLIKFDAVSLTVTVTGNQVFGGGNHNTGTYMPGIYYIEIEASSEDTVPTGTKIDMTVTIVDPCDKANGITILPGIIGQNPVAYKIYDPQIDFTLAQISATTITEAETIVDCPLIEFFVVGTGNADSAPMSTLYTWTQVTQLLSIVSSTYSMANNSYKLIIQAFYRGGGQHSYQEGGSLEITINIADPCDDPVSLSDPGQTNPLNYAFSGVSKFTMNGFGVDPIDCQPKISYACVSNTGPRIDLCVIDQNASASKATFDSVTGDYTLTSTELDVLPLEAVTPGIAPGTYVFTLEATCGLKKTQTSFTLVIEDPCPSALLTIKNPPIFPTSMTRYLRDPVAPYTWDAAQIADITGVSVDCGELDVKFFMNDGSETIPNSLLFSDNRSTNPNQFELSYTEDITLAASYSLSYKVFLANYASVEVLLTAVNSAFTVLILDPCLPPTLTITPADLSDQFFYLSNGAKQYQAAAYQVFQTWCNMAYSYSSSDTAIDSAITFDAVSRTFTFDYSADLDLSGPTSKTYTLTMTATSQSVSASKTFDLIVKNPCIEPSINTIVLPSLIASQTYYIGAGQLRYSLQNIASPPFQAQNSLCGDVQFTASLVYNATLPEPSAPVTLNATEGLIQFNTDGTFTIQSSDIGFLGQHEMLIRASLIEYPSVVTSSESQVTLLFDRCAVSVQEWILENAEIPYDTNLMYLIEEPKFEYQKHICDYDWKQVEVDVTDSQGNLIDDRSNWITSGESKFEFQFLPQTKPEAVVLNVNVTATLSDGVTKALSSYSVTYYPQKKLDGLLKFNEAPYFLISVKKLYVRFLNPNTTVAVDPVVLGKIYDVEGDTITQSFSCKNCGKEQYFTYNETIGLIFIDKAIPEGAYFIKIELSDDNINGSEKKTYEFSIQMKPQIIVIQDLEVEEKTQYNVTESNVKDDGESPNPVFKIESLDYVGLMKVSFSQELKLIEDLTSFTEKQISLEILPDESNEQEDKSVFDFSWEVTEFSQRSMTMQITFTRPEYISSGLNRDYLRMTVIEPSLFYSPESAKFILEGTNDKTKAPKMMPNTAFTKAFVGFSGSFGSATNAGMLGNFAVNFLLSGAMNMLWGLMHSMQIVAHFPLINIMMPGNAQVLFQVIVKIATFDILPTEDFIEQTEDDLGMTRTEVELTDNFLDFGFDSADPIRNLQIMAIVIACLTLFPLFSLLLRGICFCSSKCKNCIKRMNARFYWNTYIRFGLEAYLELSICAFIRFVGTFSLENGSERFYSFSSIFIIVATFAMFMIGIIVPQVHFKKLGTKEFEDRFGDLTLGLNLKSRAALIFPAIFMLRRVLYAGIMVCLISRSYFQIQFMIFKTSLSMIYVGNYRPFALPSQNNLELLNEYLTLLCTYSLIMFSNMVPDAATRYLCGWQIIFLIVLTLSINLSLIIFVSIRDSIKTCKLKYKRRQNMNALKSRQKEHFQQQNRMKKAQDRINTDQFLNLNAFNNNQRSLGGDDFQQDNPQLRIASRNIPITFKPNDFRLQKQKPQLQQSNQLLVESYQSQQLSSISEYSESSKSMIEESKIQLEESKGDHSSESHSDSSRYKDDQPYDFDEDPRLTALANQLNQYQFDSQAQVTSSLNNGDFSKDTPALNIPIIARGLSKNEIEQLKAGPTKKYKIDLMLLPPLE